MNIGDMRLVSETEAEIFDGASWVAVPGASVDVSEMGEGEGGGGFHAVVVRVGADLSPAPSGNLDTAGFHVGLPGFVAVTAGLSQSGAREFLGVGGEDGAPVFSDGGVVVEAPRDPADPMDLNRDSGSAN